MTVYHSIAKKKLYLTSSPFLCSQTVDWLRDCADLVIVCICARVMVANTSSAANENKESCARVCVRFFNDNRDRSTPKNCCTKIYYPLCDWLFWWWWSWFFLIVLFGWPICSNWIMIMCCDQSDPCCLWINVFEITFNFRRPPIITYYYLLDSHDPHAQLVFVSVLVNAKNVSIAIMKD